MIRLGVFRASNAGITLLQFSSVDCDADIRWFGCPTKRDNLVPNRQLVPEERMLSAFLCDESGATAVEYGLLAAMIGLAIAGSITSVGNPIRQVFQSIFNGLNPI